MLDSNIILGIRGNLECEEYSHGILSQEWEGWPCGTPIVYKAGMLDGKYNGSVSAMSLMTPSRNAAGRERAQVPTSIVVPVDMKPLYNNHKVLTVSRFDLGKFDRLLEFVRDVGGLSLVIEYAAGRKESPLKVQKLEKIFKYTSMFYFNGWGSKYLEGEDDRYVCVLTFLDLPYCVPIFNMRKVDGVGLSFSGATINASKDYGQLHRIFRADFVYSNVMDNVFVIDGVDVNSISPMSKDMRRDLISMAEMDLPVQPANKKSSSDKKKMSGYEMYMSSGKSDKKEVAKDLHEVATAKNYWQGNDPNQVVEVSLESNGGPLITNFPGATEGAEPEATEPEATPPSYGGVTINNNTVMEFTTSNDGMNNITWGEDSTIDNAPDDEEPE